MAGGNVGLCNQGPSTQIRGKLLSKGNNRQLLVVETWSAHYCGSCAVSVIALSKERRRVFSPPSIPLQDPETPEVERAPVALNYLNLQTSQNHSPSTLVY